MNFSTLIIKIWNINDDDKIEIETTRKQEELRKMGH